MSSPARCWDFCRRRSERIRSLSRAISNPAVLRGAGGSAGVVRGKAGLEFAAFVAEAGKVDQACSLQGELQGRREHAETILHAAAEVDGRSLFEVLRGTRNFSNAEAEVYALGEYLIVENEVIGIFEQGQFGENLAAEGAVAGVVF